MSVAPGADFGFGFFAGGGWGFGFAGRHCNLERIRAVWKCGDDGEAGFEKKWNRAVYSVISPKLQQILTEQQII